MESALDTTILTQPSNEVIVPSYVQVRQDIADMYRANYVRYNKHDQDPLAQLLDANKSTASRIVCMYRSRVGQDVQERWDILDENERQRTVQWIRGKSDSIIAHATVKSEGVHKPRGIRCLEKKRGHATRKSFPSRFETEVITLGNVERLIRTTLDDECSTIIINRRTVDIFGSNGQGIRLDISDDQLTTGLFTTDLTFKTFLECSYRPKKDEL
ncbi:hypothetical protein HY468_03425 [Candidatus Roizmanbacteria bacterium]|nr:hypothetical protein [Candidatus Roizmanbacteria bacterium]